VELDDFFPHQFCINLDTRPDRWERISSRFVEHGINRVVRFAAVDGKNLEVPSGWLSSPGAYGCLRSHLALLEQARQDAMPSVLIFEDDTVLDPGFAAKFSEYVRQLPEDWDMLFFGALHGQPVTKISSNVIRLSHSLSTYAYALKHTVYSSFIELNLKSLAVLDENTRALQKQFNCYCFLPHLAWVEDDYSDVTGEKVNLWWLKESLVLFGPEMEEVLRRTAVVISYRNQSPGSLRNLLFTIDYLSWGLPGASILILERSSEPSLSRNDLPPQCCLELLEDSSWRDRRGALELGYEMFGSSKDYFIFLDSDVFVTREDLRANLLKCTDYDFASSFRNIYDLDERDTLRILNGDAGWAYDSSAYEARRKAAVCDLCYITTRKGLRVLAGRDMSGPESEEQLSQKAEAMLRVYDSPNPARRLFCC
jgi:glycosyl transferase family 25